MTIKKFGAPIALLAATALSLSGCAANETPAAPAASGSASSGAAALSGTLSGDVRSAMGVY